MVSSLSHFPDTRRGYLENGAEQQDPTNSIYLSHLRLFTSTKSYKYKHPFDYIFILSLSKVFSAKIHFKCECKHYV